MQEDGAAFVAVGRGGVGAVVDGGVVDGVVLHHGAAFEVAFGGEVADCGDVLFDAVVG